MNMKDVKQLGAKLTQAPKAKSQHVIDAGAIRELAELLSETGLTEIEIETNGSRLRVSRATAQVVSGAPMMPMQASLAPAPAEAAPAPKASGPQAGAVPSPMVGTVYVAAQPGSAPFIKVGDTVKEGDTLLIVEAMKTMNPIAAPKGGTVREICVVDAQPVEFGQTLVIIN
jgi:acetyl-CoA carboxylase biotin carboxyl carrier protein